MKTITLSTILAAAMAFGTLAPSIASAANARRPYHNVNRANDRGNRTGDSETARLNQQQLDQARTGR